MHITERQPGDLAELRKLAKAEKNTAQKDRLLAVAHAIDGWEANDIAAALMRSRRFVQDWAYTYRDGGIEAIRTKPRGGSKPKLDNAHLPRLRARIDAGPTEEDGVCTLRGKDIRRIIDQEFGVKLSLNGAYRVLERMGYTHLAPRPKHENHDPQAQERFKEQAPFLSKR